MSCLFSEALLLKTDLHSVDCFSLSQSDSISLEIACLGLLAQLPIVVPWSVRADSWGSSAFWRLRSQQFRKCFISVLFWLRRGQVRSGSDFIGLNFLSDLVVNQGHERGARESGRGTAWDGQTARVQCWASDFSHPGTGRSACHSVLLCVLTLPCAKWISEC